MALGHVSLRIIPPMLHNRISLICHLYLICVLKQGQPTSISCCIHHCPTYVRVEFHGILRRLENCISIKYVHKLTVRRIYILEHSANILASHTKPRNNLAKSRFPNSLGGARSVISRQPKIPIRSVSARFSSVLRMLALSSGRKLHHSVCARCGVPRHVHNYGGFTFWGKQEALIVGWKNITTVHWSSWPGASSLLNWGSTVSMMAGPPTFRRFLLYWRSLWSPIHSIMNAVHFNTRIYKCWKLCTVKQNWNYFNACTMHFLLFCKTINKNNQHCSLCSVPA